MKKLIIVASTVVTLGIGTAAGLALSTTANPKLTVSCEGNSCSVQLPGAVLEEMNRTMTKTASQASDGSSGRTSILKELGKLFEQPPTQHDATVEDPEAKLIREVEKLFQ